MERLSTAWAIGRRRVSIEMLTFVRDREAAFFTMLLPVLLLVVFGSAFQGDVGPGISFTQYFLAGMIASGIVYTSFQNLAITIPQERDGHRLPEWSREAVVKTIHNDVFKSAALKYGSERRVLLLHGGPAMSYGYLVGMLDVLPDWSIASFQQRGRHPSTTQGPFDVPTMLADIGHVLEHLGGDLPVLVGADELVGLGLVASRQLEGLVHAIGG